MKRLLLIHSLNGPAAVSDIFSCYGVRDWIPFVSDYESVMDLDAAAGDGVVRKVLSGELQEEAARLRRPFYEATASLGRRYASLQWWASAVSERDTLVDDLFCHCCYLNMARRYMKDVAVDGTLCIVCESTAVMESLAAFGAEMGFEVVSHGPPFKHLPLFPRGTVRRAIAAFAYRLAGELRLWLLVRLFKLLKGQDAFLKDGGAEVILHTWVDEKCFGDSGEFKDRYFTVLPDYYRSKGLRAATFLTFLNVRRSLWEALKFFNGSEGSYIIPAEYYRLWDYMLPVSVWFQRRLFLFNGVKVGDADCTVLFRERTRVESLKFETMHYILFKRLAEKGMSPRMVLDGFENMVSDKMIQLGVRQFMAGTEICGFFHILPPPNALCLFTDRAEADVAPLPDRIICNGPRFKEILKGEHYPEERLAVGAALRYLYLYEVKAAPIQAPAQADGFNILVTLPIERTAALEVISKVTGAVKGMEGVRLLIKPHPMETSVVESLKVDKKSDIVVVAGTMAEALTRAHMVVSAATSAAIDSVMAGRAVVRVGRETQVDLDPLAWFDEFGGAVSTVAELGDRIRSIRELLDRGGDGSAGGCYRDMLPELFSPATEESMSVFLPTMDKKKTVGPDLQ